MSVGIILLSGLELSRGGSLSPYLTSSIGRESGSLSSHRFTDGIESLGMRYEYCGKKTPVSIESRCCSSKSRMH